MRSLRFLFLILIMFSISIIWGQSIARWYTSMGEFEITLREDIMPITTNNFMDLTNANFYDNFIFHRVINNFMIQDGCPQGTGYGGPGYTIPDEYHEDMLFNTPGVLGMAKSSAPNSAGSQYFITEVPYPSLNWNYAAFGNILQGFEVVQAISDVATDGNDKPLVDVVIDSIRIMTPQLNDFTPQEDSLYVNANEPMVFGLICNEDDLTYSWYVDDELQSNTSFILNLTLEVNGWHEVKGVVSNGEYELPHIWLVEITGGTNSDENIVLSGITLYQNAPNPFNPDTTIRFALDTPQVVSIEIYNINGQHIRRLTSQIFEAGTHSISWNGTDDNMQAVASGIYFYRLQAGNNIITKRALLLK